MTDYSGLRNATGTGKEITEGELTSNVTTAFSLSSLLQSVSLFLKLNDVTVNADCNPSVNNPFCLSIILLIGHTK